MTLSTEDEFISNFHSLSGLTIGERRKNLFNLLNKTQQSLRTTCSEISFTSLQPKTLLEESFKVEVLLFFKKTPNVIEVLKSENPILIEKILKADSWFIKEAFGNISGENLVTQIFPYLSVNTKLKLINKLSLHLNDVQKADEFFESIKEVYGVYLASKLLPSCSDSLIIKYINFYRVEITPRQLLNIIKKYPSLTESIFEKLHQYDTVVNIGLKYKLVFNYLMLHNVPVFLKLNAKYNPEFRLGLRTTRKFINTNKQIAVKEAKKLHRLLNTKQTTKYIRDDFEAYFLNVFPKSICKLEETYTDYLSLFKALNSDVPKFTILSTTFKSIHGSELLDHSAFLTHETMKLMPLHERETWLQTHTRPKEITEEVWISFMSTEKSVPLLKQKISLTSNVRDREKLIVSLIRTCYINKDMKALADICSYMLSKHRNDHVKVRKEFLNVLVESFDLSKFEDEHWKYIIELMHLFSINQEYCDLLGTISDAYIQYCFIKNLPVEEHLKFWLNSVNHYDKYNICKLKSEYEKKCLLIFKDLIPECYKTEDLKHQYLFYLTSIMDWNKRHPRDQLSLFIDSNAIEIVKQELKCSEYAYTSEEIAIECIKSDYKKSKDADLVQLLLTRTSNCTTPFTMLDCLIKDHPDVLNEYMEPLIRNYAETCRPHQQLSVFFRRCEHLEIPQKISKICIDIINDNKEDLSDSQKTAMVLLLSRVKSNDFIKFVSSYYPFDLVTGFEWKQGQNKFKLQKAICSCFKYTTPPYSALESILKFSKGDYLKFVKKSLYVVSHNIAENRLAPFFNVLLQRSVSVRKHAIFLVFKTMSKNEVFDVLTKLMISEKNSSICKSLFKSIFNYFVQNPEDLSWELVKENLNAVDVNDLEVFAFLTLTKSKKVPPQYFQQYIVFIWDCLEKLPNNEKIEEYQCHILDAISVTKINLLSKEFFMKIIEKYFFQTVKFSILQRVINGFVCKYIIYCSSEVEQEELIKSILQIIRTHVNSSNLLGYKFANNFVNQFCSTVREKETSGKKILKLFENAWNNSLEPNEGFEEHLILKFTHIFLDCADEKQGQEFISKVGEKLALLCDSLHNKHMFDIIMFCNCFDFWKFIFLSKEFDDELDDCSKVLILCESILKTSNATSCNLLILSLLPKEVTVYSKLQANFDHIFDAISKHPEPLVQIHLRHYIKSKEWE